MKNLIFLFFTVLFFSFTNQLSAQEGENYINVIANSLPDKYIKSNSNLFFTIQIGAYLNENKTLEKTKNIIISKEEGNLTKYRLGEFSTYKEAIEYKKIILSVCNDAFIVSIKNGKRIHITEALKSAPIL